MKKIIFILLCISSSCFSLDDKQAMDIAVIVLENIVKKAERDWPDDYSMQIRQIQREKESLIEIAKMKSEIIKYKKG